jgi:hypothetical protein
MAKQDDSAATTGSGGTSRPEAASMENRMLAFAEQLGRIVGTVQAKAEGWLDRDALTAQIATVRDSASDLLNQLGGGTPKKTAASRPAAKAAPVQRGESPQSGARSRAVAKAKPSAKGRVASKARASATSGAASAKGAGAGKGRSGGAVDAPGKKHRTPMPSESGATGAPRGEGSRIAKLKAANQNRVQRRG